MDNIEIKQTECAREGSLERSVSCPFCGGKDPVTLKQAADNGVRYAIMCQYAECCGRTGWWHTEEQAISKWNRRAANDPDQRPGRQPKA